MNERQVAIIESRVRAHLGVNQLPVWVAKDLQDLVAGCREIIGAARQTIRDIDTGEPLPTTPLRNLVKEWDR